MSFTITGNATDLDLDVAHLPTVTAQVLAPWTFEDGTLRTSHATGSFDETGALVKDGGGPWVIGAPEAAPMYLKISGLPSLRFPAPVDGATVDLADLYADNSPLPAPSPTTSYVRGASAYEVAVAEGFVGTEAEWLTSLGAVEAHAGSHASGGSDPVTPASIGAVASGDVRLRDTGWLQLAPENGWTGQIFVRRVGDQVYVRVKSLNAAASTSSNVIVLPSGFRPGPNFPAHGMGNATSNTVSGNDGVGAVGGASNEIVRVADRPKWTGGSATIDFPADSPFPAEPYPGTSA